MATEAKHIIDGEIISDIPKELVRYEAPENNLALSAVFDLATAKKRLAELQEFVKFYMQEGEDFGKIPGTPKPTLYKSGADKLCDIYGIADTYKITNRTEDWSKNLFDYEVECTLVSKRDGGLIATGLGSCNSYEGKYRYRENKRKCPKCTKETIIKGKTEYGGGWLCWNKPGKSDGCGAKFPDGDKSIESQDVGKVENEDIPTIKNTLLKMAKKRAKVDAVLSATRSSGLFTQDVEDWGLVEQHEEGSKQQAQTVAAVKVQEAGPSHKKVIIKEIGQGNVSLAGEGLSAVLVALTENMKKEMAMEWRGYPHGWVMPQKSCFVLEDCCKSQGVGVTYADEQTLEHKLERSVEQAAPAPQPAPPAMVSLGHGTITNTEEATGKKGPFMKVWQAGNKMQVFQNHQMKLKDGTTIALFTLLKTSKGKDAIFRVNKVGEYLNVVGITKLGTLAWDEAGVPV